LQAFSDDSPFSSDASSTSDSNDSSSCNLGEDEDDFYDGPNSAFDEPMPDAAPQNNEFAIVESK
jgi:hypothetical protein